MRRTTLAREPTLVVLGIDDQGHKSVLAMMQGDKDCRSTRKVVFDELKARGLDATAVQFGVMDGLPGLAAEFLAAFPGARVGRCWVNKATNVFARVPRRYQAAFKVSWGLVQYAADGPAARAAFTALKEQWSATCDDAVASMERDLEALMAHYEMPRAYWDALRTTNPIERVNKEFRRRTKTMDQAGVDSLRVILAFTALRLEFGWLKAPVTASKLVHLKYARRREERLEDLAETLLH